MDRCAAIAPIDVIQPEFSLAVRAAEEDVLPYADEHGIGSLIYSPMKHGLLSGRMTRERVAQLTGADWRHGHVEFSEPRLSRNLAIVDVLNDIAASHGCRTAEVAVAWVLTQPGVTAAITGGRSARQVEEVGGATAVSLSAAEIAVLDSVSS
jgi:aryl-alcohol dehydrogenase-like predicted oxidoreductase